MSNSKVEARRALLKGVAAVPFWLIDGDLHASSAASNGKWQQTLKILLDEIIPADEAPSATQLNVHNDILNEAVNIPNYNLMLIEGVSWLNEYSIKVIGGNSFEGISASKRIEVITFAFASPLGTLPRVFVDRIRQDAFRLYYQKQLAYSSILSMRPIQPFGYPDYQIRN